MCLRFASDRNTLFLFLQSSGFVLKDQYKQESKADRGHVYPPDIVLSNTHHAWS